MIEVVKLLEHGPRLWRWMNTRTGVSSWAVQPKKVRV